MGSERYFYSNEDRSILLPYLQRWAWDPILARLPRSIHPNTITVFGFAMEVLSTLFVVLGLYGFRWAWLLAGFCLFAYVTADNLDGPQARRTGQTHKIGEFLDHWLDTFSGALIIVTYFVLIQLEGPLFAFLLVAVCMAFFATMWEQYHTGVFVLGKIGNIEGAALLLLTFTLNFLFDNPNWIHFSPDRINYGMGLFLISFIGFPASFLAPVWRVRAHFLDLVPPAGTMLLMALWYLNGSIGWFVAATLIALTNAIFSGRVLVCRLLGESFALRNLVNALAFGAVILFALLVDLQPAHHFLLASLLVLVLIVLALRNLLMVLERFTLFRFRSLWRR